MGRRETLAAVLAMAACGGPSAGSEGVIRVGYFPNITHSQAIIGLARGDFQRYLGTGTVIEATLFNAGPSVIEALNSARIDLAYIGPNPAITGYVRSSGEALRIVAGATRARSFPGGKARSGIAVLEDLEGRRIATPHARNTQDVALRNCRRTSASNHRRGRHRRIIPPPTQILDLFRQGEIDGAWVP